MVSDRLRQLLSLLTFPTLRRLVRPARYRRLWLLAGVSYVLVAMLLGGMLTLIPGGSPINFSIWVDWGEGGPGAWFLYPALLVLHPNFALVLPAGPTVVMLLLGLFVGLAVSAGVALVVATRRARADLMASGAAPAVSGWALLGACCCVSCGAQGAAIGAVAALLGSTPVTLVGNLWPLSVVQLAFALLSLVYMETTLRRPAPPPTALSTPRSRAALSVVLRFALLVASVTWLLALFVEVSGPSPGEPTPALAYHWAVEHLLLGGLGFAAALAPGVLRALAERRKMGVWLLRLLLLAGGVTWGIGLPPPFPAWGLGGAVNEWLGYLGVPLTAGGIPPDGPLGAALLFHWLFQHLLLGAWAIACAVVPSRAAALLLPSAASASTGRPEPVGHGAPAPGPLSAEAGAPPAP